MGFDILMSCIMAEKICSYPLCDSIANPFSRELAITRVAFGICNEDYVMLMVSRLEYSFKMKISKT